MITWMRSVEMIARLRRLRAWQHRRSGNVALLVALAAVPLAGMVALSVDFGMASVIRGKLNLAADSAALLATTAASNAYRQGATNAVQQGVAAATTRFQAQSGNQADVTIDPVQVVLTQNGGLFNATVSYTAAMPTTFASVLGITRLPISGQSSATLSFNPLVDVQVLMDTSSSMTLAATTADMATLENLTANFNPQGPLPGNVGRGESCAFACHWSNTQEDYYQLALRNNVQLRVSVLQTAVTNLITTMQQDNINNRFQLGLYTFNQNFNVVYPLSYNVTGANASVQAIVPDLNDCSSNCPDTYFSKAMAGITAVDTGLPQTGSNVPQRYLLIITDGVFDDVVGGSRAIGAFSPNDCAAIKQLGVTVMVLYTPYLPIPDNAFWVDHVEPITPQIPPNLQACASGQTFFFSANDATGINTELQQMFQLVLQTSSHLIN